MIDYRAIFEAVESTLIAEGSRNLPETQVRVNLDAFKEVENKRFSDADAYWLLVLVVFYSGFRAATVNAKLPVIRHYFPAYQVVARYEEDGIERILMDQKMIKNRSKIQACVENAREFVRVVRQHGSFQAYVDSFAPKESNEGLLALKDDLQQRFAYLGEVTSYHYLMDIGMPVLKPDRVMCRIFCRLGLIESEGHIHRAVDQGLRFAEGTGHPIRYIDIVFVAYGQVQSKEFGLERGICLKNAPRCGICAVKMHCNFTADQPVPRSAPIVATHELRSAPALSEGDVFIRLPFGGAGSGFRVSQLVEHIRRSGRDYIIQAQQECRLEDHSKPHSLDVWLRENFANQQDTKQAVNSVVQALEATGQFQVVRGLVCPDSGRRCKGLKLVEDERKVQL